MAIVEPLLFQLLRDKIEPSDRQIQQAIRSHRYLRAQLDSGNFGKRIIGSYLSGSYSRDTAIHPIDDVDIVFLIAPGEWRIDFLTRFLSDLPKPEPDLLLKSFASAIRTRYESSSVFLQRRSVRLQLNRLNLDVVPAVQDKVDRFIWIPDRSKGGWIKSAPLIHKESGEDINRKRSGLFKPLVKLLKHWNSGLPTTAQLKSFSIETIAARVFRVYPLSSLEDGLTRFFDFIAWRADDEVIYNWSDACGIDMNSSGLVVPDIAATGTNVAAGVTGNRIKRFTNNARIARKRFRQAFAAKTSRGAETHLTRALRC